MSNMILLLNHLLTDKQVDDAVNSLGVKNFIYPDEELKTLWMSIIPEGNNIIDQLEKAINWLNAVSTIGDFVLVQGEYGAAFYVVDYCFHNGKIPIYATSERKCIEQKLSDGSIERKHIFKHVMFRRYMKWQNIQQ